MPVVASSIEPPAVLDDSVTDGASDSLAPENASNLSTTVRVSTTSIASSASSHGSGGSTEVVPPVKSGSRSNSSASGGASGVGAVGGAAVVPASTASTGAIPKSISFDKTADKEEESLGDLKHGSGRSFFKNLNKSWKLPKIGRRGGGARGSKGDDYHRFLPHAFL